MSIVAIGVDVGQVRDPATVVVVEYRRLQLPPAELEARQPRGLFDPEPPPLEPEFDTEYLVRALGRLPLGTGYPEVAAHVNQVAKQIRHRDPKGAVHVLLDRTGVGRAVAELVARKLDPALRFTAVTWTGADSCDAAPLHRPAVSMGKSYMVSRLQAILHDRRLKLPRSALAEDLVTELKTYEVKVMESGREKYGAFAEGAMDDLVSALGMACLGDVHQVVSYRESLYG